MEGHGDSINIFTRDTCISPCTILDNPATWCRMVQYVWDDGYKQLQIDALLEPLPGERKTLHRLPRLDRMKYDAIVVGHEGSGLDAQAMEGLKLAYAMNHIGLCLRNLFRAFQGFGPILSGEGGETGGWMISFKVY